MAFETAILPRGLRSEFCTQQLILAVYFSENETKQKHWMPIWVYHFIYINENQDRNLFHFMPDLLYIVWYFSGSGLLGDCCIFPIWFFNIL